MIANTTSIDCLDAFSDIKFNIDLKTDEVMIPL
ncbi:MAG: hypothetical protein CM15mP127_02050 [Gammaproteobacteria bacterium]|nr:MAG: hypothetical protein CM15mP127_02050 [Gammaproteobacteria bacterium]